MFTRDSLYLVEGQKCLYKGLVAALHTFRNVDTGLETALTDEQLEEKVTELKPESTQKKTPAKPEV